MAIYERFQILSSARQDLFLPEGPVWVSRCQLSRDMESGKRLLQTRMVNCSERIVRQVFLRVVCLGAERERLDQLELVPLPVLSARPGRVFGDDKLVEVPVKGTVFAEVFVQRVRFADGTAWDEPGDGDYIAFPAPVPVRPEDPHFETLASRARSGGVRNDFYFRAQQGLWLCSCGMPNPTRGLRCVRCGADRLWLEKHMDVNLLDAPEPVKAPEPAAASCPPPAPAVTVVPAPIRVDPVPAQPTIIVRPAPEPEAPEPPVSHGGRNAAILAAVLLFIALGAFCAWKLLMPYLRYREALQARAGGDYERAVAIFEELDEYRDSVDQIDETRSQKAARLMGEGKYREALEIYETLKNSDGQIADCLYSLGVLAYNDQDLETAMDYVGQLRERFPDYDKTETLERCCAYSLGGRAAAEADAAESPEEKIACYEEAIRRYETAKDYEDSAERATECRYRIARLRMEQGEALQAVALFANLGNYKDAEQLRRDCMFSYVQLHLEDGDRTAAEFLAWLVEDGYSEAVALNERLKGEGFRFRVTLGPGETDGTLLEVGDLAQVYIHYNVEARDGAVAAPVLVVYHLPDGREGRGLLNKDGSAKGVRCWTDVSFQTNCAVPGEVTLEFYDPMRGENAEPLEVVRFNYSAAANGEDPTEAGSSSGTSGSGRKRP